MYIIKLRKTSSTLLSHSKLESTSKDILSSSCEIPQGSPPNVPNSQVCENRRKIPLSSIVMLEDRKSHNEAFIVFFMAEHSLNILAPDLIRSSLELLDVKCLQPLSMARTNASYKLREGLAASLYDDAVTDLRLSFFHFSFFSFSC